MKNKISLLFSLIALLIFSSCGMYSEEEMSAFDEELKAYAGEDLANYERSESGLYFKIIEQGTGAQIKPLDNITVRYSGKLMNDSVFHDTVVTLPLAKTIDGFREGFLYFKDQGKGAFLIPAQLAYGKRNMSPLGIKENSCLYYEFEILGVE